MHVSSPITRVALVHVSGPITRVALVHVSSNITQEALLRDLFRQLAAVQIDTGIKDGVYRRV